MFYRRIKRLLIACMLIFIWGAFLFLFENNMIPGLERFKTAEAQENIPRENSLITPVEALVIIPQKKVELVVLAKPIRKKCGDFYCYTSQEFLDIYNTFETESKSPALRKYIYNNKTADDYLRSVAEKLGYQKRIFADESSLVTFENVTTRTEVRDAYKKMRNEMKEEGIRLHFVSGYRSSNSQRSIFKRKASIKGIENIPTGLYDPAIYKTLAVSALPGYSKHHSGYAVDFGCGNKYLVYSFADTECYDWMAANNFENTKRFGFIPSYPEGVENQGPNPEPWEFVWVGVHNLK